MQWNIRKNSPLWNLGQRNILNVVLRFHAALTIGHKCAFAEARWDKNWEGCKDSSIWQTGGVYHFSCCNIDDWRMFNLRRTWIFGFRMQQQTFTCPQGIAGLHSRTDALKCNPVTGGYLADKYWTDGILQCFVPHRKIMATDGGSVRAVVQCIQMQREAQCKHQLDVYQLWLCVCSCVHLYVVHYGPMAESTLQKYSPKKNEVLWVKIIYLLRCSPLVLFLVSKKKSILKTFWFCFALDLGKADGVVGLNCMCGCQGGWPDTVCVSDIEWVIHLWKKKTVKKKLCQDLISTVAWCAKDMSE